MIGTPQVDTLILWSWCYKSSIWRETRLDLAGHIGVALVFAHQTEVPEVVESDPGVGGGDEDPVLAWHGLDTRHLPASAVLAAGALDMNGGVVLQLLCGEEDHSAIIGSNYHKLACK